MELGDCLLRKPTDDSLSDMICFLGSPRRGTLYTSQVIHPQEVAVLHSSLTKSDPKVWVVHCRRDRFDVYIGRDNPSLGRRDVGFGNPFSHKAVSSAEFRVATRQEAIERFDAWLLTQPKLLERIKRELKGKTLGCWCTPLACHGEVLARIANDLIVPRSTVEQISLF